MLLREDEIKRLNFALKGGRPHDVISLEAQNISNEKYIAHLNLQASTPDTHHVDVGTLGNTKNVHILLVDIET